MATTVKKAGKNLVTVMVNGEVTGTIPNNVTIGAAAEQVANKAGLRSFSIKVNGKKISQPDANKLLTGVKTFEIFAKDARG